MASAIVNATAASESARHRRVYELRYFNIADNEADDEE